MTFQEFMLKQIELAYGEVNRWCTGEAVGHDPNDEECLAFWTRPNGGAADFAKNYRHLVVD